MSTTPFSIEAQSKTTDFIYNLYADKNLNLKSFDKTYLVSFMNRNDKNVEHLSYLI